MSSLENNIHLGLETDTTPLPDCDTEFQHFSETVSQSGVSQPGASQPQPFCFGDTPLTPLVIGQRERFGPVTAFPSIQAILSVTGTIDIDKFNKGFEENIEVDQEILENKWPEHARYQQERGSL